jgi:mono/diheme cytochrome c family protein
MNDAQRIGVRPARLIALAGAALVTAAATAVGAQETAQLTGDPERGESAYTHEYKCYACHGYDAQTGERRLLPMNYTLQGFVTFVQNSPLPQMPAYPDMPAQALADVFAYVQTIPVRAPEVEDLPLLKDLRDRKLQALTETQTDAAE